MLTKADIPPGGEGKIEVTFDSGIKKGQQNKSVTVESNDPRNPRTSLNISVFIEVEFAFEGYSLDMGKIRKGRPVSKTATLLYKDPAMVKTISFTSSSPYLTAAIANTPAPEKGRLQVDISATAEMPVGRINAAITARAGDSAALDTRLQIVGAVVGNFDISSDAVRFHIDTTKSGLESVKQTVTVFETTDEARFHILGVEESYGRLAFHIDTLLADKQYEITMTPTSAVLAAKQTVSGVVTITTDDAEQPSTSVNFTIFFGR